MSLQLTRNKQFGIKIESTNGTAETLSASDYGLELTELTANANVEMIENDVFKNSLSSSTDRVGKKTAQGTIAGEFKSSGTLNTEPKISPILQCARLKKYTVKGMVVSGETGTLKRGAMVIVGGTSTARGVAVKSDSGKLYVAVISGTFQSGEALTSIPSGYTATAGAQDAGNTGFAYCPDSTTSSEKCATINILDGGLEKFLFGSVFGLGLEITPDSYAKWTSSFMGICDPSNWGTEGTEVTGIAYESDTPAIVSNAVLKIGTSFSPIVAGVTLDLGNNPMVIKDMNSDTWLKYGVVTDRNVTGTLNVMAIDPSDYALYTAFFNGSTASLEFVIGSGAGKQIEIAMDAIQYTGVTEGDDSGFLTQSINFKATGLDNELVIWFR
jgi:hypothetical protein